MVWTARGAPTRQTYANQATASGAVVPALARTELGLPVGELDDPGVHLHVSAGSVPEDGPSAAVTVTTAPASLLSGRPVRADVAMTGEPLLTGRILPIGGFQQELLAAHRAGSPRLFPARGAPDLDDVPETVLEVHRWSDMRDVLAPAYEQVLPA